MQWLPWILSPRIAFEYHFFPNLAIILLADAALLQRIWAHRHMRVFGFFALPNVLTAIFLAVSASLSVMWVAPGGALLQGGAAVLTFILVFLLLWAQPRVMLGVYIAAAIAAFIFWYPITAATPLTWRAWDMRMLTQMEGNNWINPHPGK
jgi:dolichyl-phosphate-mannose--protein O-mannosyl transferase